MKFENTKVYNLLEAIQAARLSWGSESDSPRHEGDSSISLDDWHHPLVLGTKDMELAGKLVAKGPSHRKFMRQILLSTDIIAPRYWWLQFDTYKVGVTSCSESTMHTLMKNPIDWRHFTHVVPSKYLYFLEELREKGDFERLVGLLPQGYVQKRHVTMNYEVVRNIREQREGHKLPEWQEFIEWSDTLPHAGLFFGKEYHGD